MRLLLMTVTTQQPRRTRTAAPALCPAKSCAVFVAHFILSGFLSELLGRDIEVLEILESESNSDGLTDKRNRLDFKAKIDGGEIVVFEMQVGRQSDFLLRILFGASKAVTEQLSADDHYEKINKVYSIAIIYFDFGKGDDYIYSGKTEFRGIHTGEPLLLSSKEKRFMPNQDKNAGEVFPDYYLICPKRFDGNIKNALDEWVYTFKNSEVEEEFTAAGIQAAGKKLNVQKMTKAQREDHEIFLKARRVHDNEVQCAIEDGIEKGIEKRLEKAVEEAVEKVNAEWQGVVADKDAALADQAALIARLQAKLGGNAS